MTEPPAPHTDNSGIRDFTLKRQPFVFQIDGDVFRAPAKLSIGRIKKVANLAASMGEVTVETDLGQLTETVSKIYRLLLPGVSGERFVARLQAEEDDNESGEEPVEPIDLLGEALPVLMGILEHYGMRPTKPSQPSLDGLMAELTATQSDDTSSTDGASPDESTSENSDSLTG